MKNIIPDSINILLKEYVSKKVKLSQRDNTMGKSNNEFNSLFQKINMGELFLKTRN
jgi:hypothetical protein